MQFTPAALARFLAQVRSEERERCAQVLEVEANTIGGAVGAALTAVAAQVRQVRQVRGPASRPEATPEETAEERAHRELLRQREVERLQREFAEEDERIERERQSRVVLDDVSPGPTLELPPERQYDDAEDISALVRGRRLSPPPSL